MNKTALIIGATGSTGRCLVNEILQSEEFSELIIVHHRKTTFSDLEKVTEIVVDFDQLQDELSGVSAVDYVFCTIGTTIKKAGSKEAFVKVDFDYVVALGCWAIKKNVKSFTVISSIGAKNNSPFLYVKTKGKMEVELKNMQFPTLNIMRPSVLHDENRNERRVGEQVMVKVMNVLTTFFPKSSVYTITIATLN